MSEFRIDLRVRFAETDAMGVAHHAAYLPYLETARVEYLRSLGHPYRDLRDRDGMEFAVVGVDVRYHAPLRFDDEFTVTCALAERARATFSLAYRVELGAPAHPQRSHAPRGARPRDRRPAAPARLAGGPAGRGQLSSYQLRPPSMETSSSPSGATAYQMRSLRGSDATIVARGPLVCQRRAVVVRPGQVGQRGDDVLPAGGRGRDGLRVGGDRQAGPAHATVDRAPQARAPGGRVDDVGRPPLARAAAIPRVEIGRFSAGRGYHVRAESSVT